MTTNTTNTACTSKDYTDRVGVTSEEIDAIAGKLEDALEHISHGGHRGDARLAVLEAQHLVEDLGSRAVDLVNEQLLAALHAWVRADTNGITPTEGKRLRELTRAAIDAAERCVCGSTIAREVR